MKLNSCLPNYILLFFIFSIFFTVPIAGQVIEITKGEAEIEKIRRPGILSCIELDRKTVEKGLSRKLKEYGKIELSKGGIMIGRGLFISSITSSAMNFFTRIESNASCTNVFISSEINGKPITDGNSEFEALKKFLREFTIDMYRADLNEQITEAERTVDKAVRAHEKTTNEGESLKRKIKRNGEEKERLLKNLKENADNLIKLKSDSAQNILNQESALEEIKKVRKIAEEKKAKLSTIY